MDVSGHDSDFAFVGFDYSWAVGSDDSGFVLGSKGVLYFDHVVLGNTFVKEIVPSVMTTQSSSSASRAYMMALAAPGGGT